MVDNHDERKNEKAMRLQLDLVDEVRATAEQRLAQYQNRMAMHYNSRVRHRDFQVEDLILRNIIGVARDPTQRKLGPNWEGPYQVTSWHLPPRNDGQTEARPPMERRAPTEVLPVKRMV